MALSKKTGNPHFTLHAISVRSLCEFGSCASRRFTSRREHQCCTVAGCPLWVDAVDKVGGVQRAGNNRIQVSRFLNQCCAPDSYLQSMLLTRPSKNVFRQHRSIADLAATRQVGPLCASSGSAGRRLGQRFSSFVSAATSSRTSGFMKNVLSRGVMFT